MLKQWDATLDDGTRPSHAIADGELRELDKPFPNGLMFLGDPDGGAGEVINCRCALLQRASWELDEDELEELKERAAFFGLDKTESFEEYKRKYLKAADDFQNKYQNPYSVFFSGVCTVPHEVLDQGKSAEPKTDSALLLSRKYLMFAVIKNQSRLL